MRKSQRPQSPTVHGRAHRYRVEHDTTAERERDRLERALEIGLEDTFPASDPVAVVQPSPTPDVNGQGRCSIGQACRRCRRRSPRSREVERLALSIYSPLITTDTSAGADIGALRICAISGLMHRSKQGLYSITNKLRAAGAGDRRGPTDAT
jgi:hypothetical protein